AGGLLADAREYYSVALRLEKEDPVLWINAGTLDRQLGENKAAIDKYSKALMLNPNDAYAHYNLGAT
ncbi:MAG: tetratricopeptide repeat protein, partial [Gammaproteobacteria bacterium]|nr:tetratricopeptide repeat protein [Gammaproteobacteria bacterium]